MSPDGVARLRESEALRWCYGWLMRDVVETVWSLVVAEPNSSYGTAPALAAPRIEPDARLTRCIVYIGCGLRETILSVFIASNKLRVYDYIRVFFVLTQMRHISRTHPGFIHAKQRTAHLAEFVSRHGVLMG